MACSLCGRDEEDGRQSHFVGCARADEPDLTDETAAERGLIALPEPKKFEPAPEVEVLKEGSMTTVPESELWDPEEYDPKGDEPEGGDTADECEYAECTEPKHNSHPRTKYCEVHKDPKNRKE